ncbi:MAG: hypothetical protein KAS32_29135 [Candidatus Peribacteraceae bacterium]|nr:hypothetical protein [Candidatus Peribacteraceae bacterium]
MTYITEKFLARLAKSKTVRSNLAKSRIMRSKEVKRALNREKGESQEHIAERMEAYKRRLAMTHGKKTIVKLKAMIKRAMQKYKKLQKIR